MGSRDAFFARSPHSPRGPRRPDEGSGISGMPPLPARALASSASGRDSPARQTSSNGSNSSTPSNARGPRSPEQRSADATEAMLLAHRRELASLDLRLNGRIAELEQRLASVGSSAATRADSAQKLQVPGATTAPPAVLSRVEQLESRLRQVEQDGVQRRPAEMDQMALRLAALEQRLGREARPSEGGHRSVEVQVLDERIALLEKKVAADAAKWSELNGEFEKTVSLLDEAEVKSPTMGLGKRRSNSELELDEVRDAVGEAKKYFEHAISSIREDLLQLEENLEHRVHNEAATRDLSVPLDIAVKDRDRYKVKDSVWDAALFIGFQAFDTWTHSLLAIAFIFNLAIQSLLCAIVCFAIADDTYTPGIAEDLAAWRLAANLTEVRKICDGDSSLSIYDMQRELYDEAQNYVDILQLPTTQIAIGPVLSALVIFMWTLNVSSVIRDVVDFVKSVNNLHQTSAMFIVRHPTPGVFRLMGVNRFRFVYAVCAGFLQVVIAILLLVGGSLWLVYTKSIKDLMLNAVALAYVMEFDELLYNVIIPRKVKALIGGMEPWPLNRPHQKRVLEGVRSKLRCCPRHWPKKAVYTFAFSIAIEVFFIVGFITPNYDRVYSVRDAICPESGR